MVGRPIDSGDVVPLVFLAASLIIVVFAKFGRILKPTAEPPAGPSPQTVACLTRHIRTSLTFSGANLALCAVAGLLSHRVPPWLWWSVAGVQVLVLAAFWVHIIHSRREGSR